MPTKLAILLVLFLASALVAVAEPLTIINGNNFLNTIGGEIAHEGTMSTWTIDAPGSISFTPKDSTSFFYTNLFCRDFSAYSGIQINITAPAGSSFTVHMQNPSSSTCKARGGYYSKDSARFVTFSGSGLPQTFRIPFDYFNLFDPKNVFAIVFTTFNNFGQKCSLHSVVFDEGPGAPVYCPSFSEGTFTKNFDTMERWQDASQAGGGPSNYIVANGMLRLQVDAGTKVHPKIRYPDYTNAPGCGGPTPEHLNTCSNYDDYHEFDFEIGYGALDIRRQLGAADNEMVAYMTTQATDGNSWSTLDGSQVAIASNKWHDLMLDFLLDKTGTQYTVRWWIDGKLMKTSGQSWGPEYVGRGFQVYCSLENLWWMGLGYNGVNTTVPRTNGAVWETYKFTPVNGYPDSLPPPDPIEGDSVEAAALALISDLGACLAFRNCSNPSPSVDVDYPPQTQFPDVERKLMRLQAVGTNLCIDLGPNGVTDDGGDPIQLVECFAVPRTNGNITGSTQDVFISSSAPAPIFFAVAGDDTCITLIYSVPSQGFCGGPGQWVSIYDTYGVVETSPFSDTYFLQVQFLNMCLGVRDGQLALLACSSATSTQFKNRLVPPDSSYQIVTPLSTISNDEIWLTLLNNSTFWLPWQPDRYYKLAREGAAKLRMKYSLTPLQVSQVLLHYFLMGWEQIKKSMKWSSDHHDELFYRVLQQDMNKKLLQFQLDHVNDLFNTRSVMGNQNKEFIYYTVRDNNAFAKAIMDNLHISTNYLKALNLDTECTKVPNPITHEPSCNSNTGRWGIYQVNTAIYPAEYLPLMQQWQGIVDSLTQPLMEYATCDDVVPRSSLRRAYDVVDQGTRLAIQILSEGAKIFKAADDLDFQAGVFEGELVDEREKEAAENHVLHGFLEVLDALLWIPVIFDGIGMLAELAEFAAKMGSISARISTLVEELRSWAGIGIDSSEADLAAAAERFKQIVGTPKIGDALGDAGKEDLALFDSEESELFKDICSAVPVPLRRRAVWSNNTVRRRPRSLARRAPLDPCMFSAETTRDIRDDDERLNRSFEGTWDEREKNCPDDPLPMIGERGPNRKPDCDHLLELQEVIDQFLGHTYNGLSQADRELLCTEWREGRYEEGAYDIINGRDNLRGVDHYTDQAKKLLWGKKTENIATNIKKRPKYAILDAITYLEKIAPARKAVATAFSNHIKDFANNVFGDAANPTAARIKGTLQRGLDFFDGYIDKGRGSKDEMIK
ncbi:hypothetical protein HK104_003491, partial [Borealophlyctis nickersoniae]